MKKLIPMIFLSLICVGATGCGSSDDNSSALTTSVPSYCSNPGTIGTTYPNTTVNNTSNCSSYYTGSNGYYPYTNSISNQTQFGMTNGYQTYYYQWIYINGVYYIQPLTTGAPSLSYGGGYVYGSIGGGYSYI